MRGQTWAVLGSSIALLAGMAWADDPNKEPRDGQGGLDAAFMERLRAGLRGPATKVHMKADDLIVFRKTGDRGAWKRGDAVGLTFEGLPDHRVKVSLTVPGHESRSWAIQPRPGGRVWIATGPSKGEPPVTLDCERLIVKFPSE